MSNLLMEDFLLSEVERLETELAAESRTTSTTNLSQGSAVTRGSKDTPKFTRYALPKSDEDVAIAKEISIPVSTRNDTNYCVKTWKEWANYRNKVECSRLVPLEPASAELTDLAWAIERFVLEVRKKDGVEYIPNSLHHLVCGIMRNVRVNRPTVDFFKDDVFSNFRSILDGEMKRLKKAGKGSIKRQAEPLTLEDEDRLWNDGILGDHSPHSLLNTVFFMCGLYFALRSGGEHRVLRLSSPQITLHTALDGSEYLMYTEDSSKNHQGGLKQRKIATKSVKHWANTENSSRCFVRYYKMYLSKLPSDCSKDAFYFKPLQKWSSSSKIWFSKQPLGHNKLQTMMATMCSKAGIEGFKTNHSLRATNATRLYRQGVDEQLIMERTGHRSIEGVRSYKRTDESQEKQISSLLQQTSTSNIQLAPSTTTTTIDNLPHLQIQNCSDFTININYSK